MIFTHLFPKHISFNEKFQYVKQNFHYIITLVYNESLSAILGYMKKIPIFTICMSL